MIDPCCGIQTVTHLSEQFGIESVVALEGNHSSFLCQRIDRLHERASLQVLHQTDHVAVDSTGKAMVALTVLVELETRRLFIMAIEAISLSLLVHVDAMNFSYLSDV